VILSLRDAELVVAMAKLTYACVLLTLRHDRLRARHREALAHALTVTDGLLRVVGYLVWVRREEAEFEAGSA